MIILSLFLSRYNGFINIFEKTSEATRLQIYCSCYVDNVTTLQSVMTMEMFKCINKLKQVHIV